MFPDHTRVLEVELFEGGLQALGHPNALELGVHYHHVPRSSF